MSIASIAANIKQRQKIAHALGYWKRLEEEKKDIKPAEIFIDECVCDNCGFRAYYKYMRCPMCEQIQ